MPFTVGESIGPYRLVEQLGQGGMATVFKAYHAALDRYVAIKALHQAFTIEPNFLTRFQREAQVVAKLEHPNIVPVYDFAEHEGRPYLVMKFIEGETLKARLKQGKLGESELLQIVESVGAALSYAHNQGVLHRDVKPSNVLLANDGRIYLADFGLARMAQAGESTISSDVMLGTPQYISPEQAMGQRDLDKGTDIYSFGVLLYELLVGRVPYSADTPYSVIHDHIYAPLPMPRAITPELPEAYERILLKALAKDRLDRFEDIDSLVDAWRRAAADSGKASSEDIPAEEIPSPKGERLAAAAVPEEEDLVSSQPLTPVPEETPKKKKTKSGCLWAAGIVLLLFICLVALSAIGRRSEAAKKAENQTQTAMAAQQGVLQVTDTPGNLSSTEESKQSIKPAGQLTPAPARTANPTQALMATNQAALEPLMKKVTENPDDPYARFDLALAYWQNGMEGLGEIEFNKAMRQAPLDIAFYTYAGEKLLDVHRWLAAAKVYLQAIRNADASQIANLRDRLYLAIYLAASDPAAGVLLDSDQLAFERTDPYLREILRARHSLYNGDPEKAQKVVDDLIKRGVQDHELKLLEAEILLFNGETEQARLKFEALTNDSSAPQWVVKVANHILNELFSP